MIPKVDTSEDNIITVQLLAESRITDNDDNEVEVTSASATMPNYRYWGD